MPENELGPVGDIVADPVTFMHTAEMEVRGRLPWSSNATFLAELSAADQGSLERDAEDHNSETGTLTHLVVYKPIAGERPLWDFPSGLDRRECAAYELSDHLGWDIVPPTIVRDGPFGQGSVQWFVDADHSQHYFTLQESHPELADEFLKIAVFDIVVNNTDRKAGHVLLEGDRVWAIDNGLCFAVEDKLRTVIWEFAGDPIPEEFLEALAPLVTEVPERVAHLLEPQEVGAMQERVGRLLMVRTMPTDPTGYRYPWPLV